MAVVYRYTDLHDEIVKYVGIVWSGGRTLKQRDIEHRNNDDWCKNGSWRVEYLKRDVNSRTDAEMLEAHYISKFGTDEYFNVKKSGWGESDFVDSDEEWELYSTDEEQKSSLVSFESVEAISIESRSFSCVFGGFPTLTIESESASFVFDLSHSLWINYDDNQESMLSVNTQSFLEAYFKYNNFEQLDDIISNGKIAISYSEVTGDIEFFVILNDNSEELNIAFMVLDCGAFYGVNKIELFFPEEGTEALEPARGWLVDFIADNNLKVYDSIDIPESDEEYRKTLRKSFETGRLQYDQKEEIE